MSHVTDVEEEEEEAADISMDFAFFRLLAWTEAGSFVWPWTCMEVQSSQGFVCRAPCHAGAVRFTEYCVTLVLVRTHDVSHGARAR